jgi:hypothetical protein
MISYREGILGTRKVAKDITWKFCQGNSTHAKE